MKLVNKLLQPCLVKALQQLQICRNECSSYSWFYGDFIIALSEVYIECDDLNPSEHYYDLTVYEKDNRNEPLLDVSRPDDWTWGRLQSFIIEKSHVTVAALAQHVANKSAVYYKRDGNCYVMCEEAEATWVSLPSGKQSTYLPMGYPLIFIEFELSSLTREFSGKTPDMCVDADEFFRFYNPEMNITKHFVDDSSSDCYSYVTRSRTILLAGVSYSLFCKKGFDEENSFHEEKWEKNGALHRVSGPAETKVLEPGIPSEGYLAEATESWYENGNLLKSIDNTEEVIISQWPISKQKYFGYFAD